LSSRDQTVSQYESYNDSKIKADLVKENRELKATCSTLAQEVNELKANLENRLSQKQEDLNKLENKYNDRNIYCVNIENNYNHLKNEIERLRKLNGQLRLDLEGAEVDILNYLSKNSDLAQENERLLTKIDNMDYLAFRGKLKGVVKLRVVQRVVDVNTKEPIITDLFKPDKPEKDNKPSVYDLEALSKDMNFNDQPIEDNKGISQSIEQDKAMSTGKAPSSEERKESGDEFPVEEKPQSIGKESKEDEWIPEIQEDRTEQLEEKKQIDDINEPIEEVQEEDSFQEEDKFQEEKKNSMQDAYADADGKLKSEEDLKLNFDNEGFSAKEPPIHSLLGPGTQEEDYKVDQGITTDLADIYKYQAPGASMINNKVLPDIHKMHQSVLYLKDKEAKTKEEIMMMESERRYRNCLINTQAEWYNSQWLDIEIARDVYKESKYMKCRLLFKNKCANKIYIKKLEAVSYDTSGNIKVKNRVKYLSR